MPKKIVDEEYDEEEDGEDNEEEEDEDREEAPAPARKKGQGRPAKRQLPPLPKKAQQRPQQQPQQAAEPQKRYVAFAGNEMGITDAESNEALTGVSGIVNLEQRQLIISLVHVLLQGQADIIERLERIENAIGVMQ